MRPGAGLANGWRISRGRGWPSASGALANQALAGRTLRRSPTSSARAIRRGRRIRRRPRRNGHGRRRRGKAVRADVKLRRPDEPGPAVGAVGRGRRDAGQRHRAAASGRGAGPAGGRSVYLHQSAADRAVWRRRPAPWRARVWCAGSRVKRCRRMECMTELTPDRLWPRLEEVLRTWQSRKRSA